MYDPTVGRFINLDPIGFTAGDTNTNRYVGNRVTIATDPTGLRETDDRWITWTKSLVDVTGKVEAQVNFWVTEIWRNDQSLFLGWPRRQRRRDCRLDRL